MVRSTRVCVVALVLTVVLAWLATASVARAAPESTAAQTSEGSPLAEIEIDERGYVVVPTPTARAVSWHRSGNRLWVGRRLWGLLVPGLIVFFGVSARMRDKAKAVARKPWQALIVFLLGYALLTFILDFPLSYYASYLRPHAYGLSEQSFAKWLGDGFKSLLLGMGALCLVVPGTLYFVRKSPERWWIWTSMVAVPLAFLVLMLLPVFISPLFNDFGPMKDAGLEAEILALAERAGIEGSRVFEVDKSVDTKTVNAFVTGFWSTKRIVLWDTIIARLERDELLVVMGHEMGHYVLGHVRNSMLLAAVSIPVSLWLFHVSAKALIARFSPRFGFESIADVAALPLFILLTSVFTLVGAPLGNAWSRYQEHESDRFALEISQDNEACARAFARLQQSNLGNPRPGRLYVLWRGSHPSLGDRIDFCNEYRPWQTGEAQRYVELFGE